MWKRIFLLLCVCPFFACAQIITTIAGNGSFGSGGDNGLAIYSTLFPTDVAFDKIGNLYISENNRIRKIDAISGIISTIAGNGTAGYSGDNGPATAAMIDHPQSIVIDNAGNVYYCDLFQNRIRVVSPDGLIRTFAGNGVQGFSGDGVSATAAMINNPLAISIDGFGNLYFTDGQRIRRVNTLGIMTTIVGNGVVGYSGDGGPATSASIHNPHGIAVDKNGNIYIADSDNKRVRKVTITGIINTIAGNGSNSYSGDNGPATSSGMYPWDLTIDKYGNLFISDEAGNAIRLVNTYGYITTITGNGSQGFSGDSGAAINAQLNHPYGLVVDSCGDIFFADGSNARVRKVTYPHCGYLSVTKDKVFAVNIYPNPANDILHIDNVNLSAKYRLLSVVGTCMLEGNLHNSNNTVPLQAIPAGIYMVEVCNDAGERTVRKIIKQ